MEGGALLSDWWQGVSKDFVPYLNVTTHLDDAPDETLFGEKGGTGFPTLFFIEPDTGAVLNEWWWPEDEKTVREMMGTATTKAADLKQLLADAKSKPNNKALQAQVKITLAMMSAGEATVDELMAIGKTEGLDPEFKAEFEIWLSGKRVTAAYEAAQEKAESRKEGMELTGEAFYALAKEGVRLAPDHQMASFYYETSLDKAIEKADKKTAEAACNGLVETLEKMAADRPSFADRINSSIADAKAKLEEFLNGEEKDS